MATSAGALRRFAEKEFDELVLAGGYLCICPVADMVSGFCIEDGRQHLSLWMFAQSLYEPIDEFDLTYSIRVQDDGDDLRITGKDQGTLRNMLISLLGKWMHRAYRIGEHSGYIEYLENEIGLENPHVLRNYGLALARVGRWAEADKVLTQLAERSELGDHYRRLDYIHPVLDLLRRDQFDSVHSLLDRTRIKNLESLGLN